MKQFEVTAREQGIKCIKLCQKLLPGANSSFLYKMLRKKNITLNGKKSDGTENLSTGDVLTFFFSDETYLKFSQGVGMTDPKIQTNASQKVKAPKKTNPSESQAIRKYFDKSAVIYEDEDVLFYNKPAGLLSQKAKPSDISLNEVLLHYVSDASNALQKPSICNRLDRNTSGLVIFGKTYHGIACMNEMLKLRKCEKYYHCIVTGEVKEAIELKGYLVKDEKTNKVTVLPKETADSSYIETHLRPLKTSKNLTLLEVHLITGKTHQIRAHLSSIGHPIIGDMKYGGSRFAGRCKEEYGVSHQLLHAYRLVFPEDDSCLEQLRGKEYLAKKPNYFTRVENRIG